MALREALTRHGFALAGALTSRFVEQLSGSPTAADVFTFWVLVVGMLAAAVALGSPASRTIDEEVNAARRTTRSGYSKRRALVFAAIAIILEAWQLAYEYDKKAFDANPLELTNHYRLAFSAWELGKLGDNEKQIEAVELYVRLTGLAPADWVGCRTPRNSAERAEPVITTRFPVRLLWG